MAHLSASTIPVRGRGPAMRRFAWCLGFLLGLLFCVVSLRGILIANLENWIPGVALSAHRPLPARSPRSVPRGLLVRAKSLRRSE